MEFGQDTEVIPLLFMKSAMGFLMTTESQDLGSTSHPKDYDQQWFIKVKLAKYFFPSSILLFLFLSNKA